MDYAESGDLSGFEPEQIAAAMGVEPRLAGKLLAVLACCGGNDRAGFIDTSPRLRVHNWWRYAGEYLRSKYRRTPAKWLEVKEMYGSGTYRVPDTSSTSIDKIREDKIIPPPTPPKRAKPEYPAETLELATRYFSEVQSSEDAASKNAAKKNIAKLLREKNATPEMLTRALDNYLAELVVTKTKYRYRARNFFGRAGHWRAYLNVTPDESSEVTQARTGDKV